MPRKLTKQEIFYIEQNPNNLTIMEMSKELERTPKTIARYYKEKPKGDTKKATKAIFIIRNLPIWISKLQKAKFQWRQKHSSSVFSPSLVSLLGNHIFLKQDAVFLFLHFQ